MKIIKVLLGIVGVLVAIFLIVPAFVSSKAQVQRSVEISAPIQEVYAVLSDMNHYHKWDPFSEMDPGSKYQVEGIGVGSSHSWQGEKVGEGKMVVTALEPNQSVKAELIFLKPWESKAQSGWMLEPTGSGAKVTWEFSQEFSYLQRYFVLTMDSMLGPAFEKGLTNLKKYIEKK